MAAKSEDIVLELPWEILDSCNGFALDIGGSVLKLVYIHKDDAPGNDPKQSGTKGKLHITSLSHDKLKDSTAFSFIKENVYIKRDKENDDPPTICCTGFMAAILSEQINGQLGIKVKCLNEMDCFVQSLVYLSKNIPLKEFLHGVDETDKQLALIEAKSIAKMMAAMTGKSSTTVVSTETGQKSVLDTWLDYEPLNEESPLASQGNIFPCMIIICGSGCVAMMVNEDGSFQIIDGSRRAGKLWMGMGSVLTNAKSYDELMNLAEKGSIEPIDFTTRDITAGMPPPPKQKPEPEKKDENFYSKLGKHIPTDEAQTVYCFGKAANKSIDDFKKEDLAKSYLNVLVADTVAFGMGSARIKDLKNVFYCGGFVNHPLMRQMIYREWMRRGVEIASVGGIKEAMRLYLVKNAAHMGAIGALLHHKLNFQA